MSRLSYVLVGPACCQQRCIRGQINLFGLIQSATAAASAYIDRHNIYVSVCVCAVTRIGNCSFSGQLTQSAHYNVGGNGSGSVDLVVDWANPYLLAI